MARIKKEDALKAQDLGREIVNVPEWGGEIELRGLSGTERDAFEASVVDRDGDKASVKLDNLRAKLLVRCIYDEEGNRMFSDAEAVELGKKSGAVLARLCEVAQRLSGLTKKDVEELAKNLPAAQSEGSTSA